VSGSIFRFRAGAFLPEAFGEGCGEICGVSCGSISQSHKVLPHFEWYLHLEQHRINEEITSVHFEGINYICMCDFILNHDIAINITHSK
jgi:hypothetical protein